VTWHAARIEKWLNENISHGIYIDSYDVTIFPAETSRNTITKMAKSADDLARDENYSAVFLDLAGGKTEYIVSTLHTSKYFWVMNRKGKYIHCR
jgi:hypothetical protein